VPPEPAAPSGHPPWPRRHPIWSAVIAFFAVLAVIGVATSTTGSRNAGPSSPAPSPRPSETPASDASTLSCDAQAVGGRPADHAIAKVRVRTKAHARVTAAGPLALVRGERATGRASASGTRMLRFRVGDARPGAAVVVTVRVSRDDSTGTCRASLRPRAAVIAAAAAPAEPTSKPTAAAPPPAAAPAPPPTTAASPPPTAASCHPLSDEGTCYEPGEFCRDSDHGMTGVAGDGEAIECEDNDGWRWEPV
jgi:hypothetical protein